MHGCSISSFYSRKNLLLRVSVFFLLQLTTSSHTLHLQNSISGTIPVVPATGDLLFVSPPYDPSIPLDNAIQETGIATIEWLRNSGLIPVDSGNETASHVAIYSDGSDGSGPCVVQAMPGANPNPNSNSNPNPKL